MRALVCKSLRFLINIVPGFDSDRGLESESSDVKWRYGRKPEYTLKDYRDLDPNVIKLFTTVIYEFF